MNRSRRGTYIWLALLGAAVGLIALASAFGTVSTALAGGLVILYLGIAFAALANMRLRALRLTMPNLAATTRVTPAARKAAQRARTRPEYMDNHTLTDIGLIVNEKRADGKWARQLAQVISLENDAIQPFVIVYATPENSNRIALVKFDIYDQAGRVRFSRTCEQWIRDDENLIVCDRQLPLQEANDIGRSGVWDLRVTIDGALAAIHSFNVTPSTAERRRQFSSDGEARLSDNAVPDEDGPMSLEDLLQEQRQSSSNSHN
ncbi:MAG: hypothetical protein ABI947_13510 [Chloroflexota bacterium]